MTARRVPIPLVKKVKEELERMKNSGIIEEVTKPTDWCAPMVPVLKPSGAVRICTDFRKLNQALKRERYMIPTTEDIFHKLKEAKFFSKLDATQGFHQIPLDLTTAELTTFITPCGRFYYKRLPFGISSAPEIFQRVIEGILGEETNAIGYIDDILVFGKTEEEHDRQLDRVIEKLTAANLKLNRSKCEFKKKEVQFLGHKISQEGAAPDPSKIRAILEMPDPINVPELRRFMGMVNYLGRYLPDLSTTLKPISELLEKDREWIWGPAQSNAADKVRE
ncbi:hypothetical protein ACOMHN_002400 [Nucella lapillus]